MHGSAKMQWPGLTMDRRLPRCRYAARAARPLAGCHARCCNSCCRRLPATCRVVRVATREGERMSRVALLLFVVSTTLECSARHERPLVLFRRSSSRPPPLGRRGFGLKEALVGVVPRQLPGALRTASGPRSLARRGRLERHAAEMSLVEMNLAVAELLVTPCSPRPGIRSPAAAARSAELSSPVLDLAATFASCIPFLHHPHTAARVHLAPSPTAVPAHTLLNLAHNLLFRPFPVLPPAEPHFEKRCHSTI
jgi:hypothetical protein